MEDDSYLIVKILATSLALMVLTLAGCTMQGQHAYYRAIEGGADPIRLACADGKREACIALGMTK